MKEAARIMSGVRDYSLFTMSVKDRRLRNGLLQRVVRSCDVDIRPGKLG